MLLWVYFPPEFLAEVLCPRAHGLQIVEILGRDTLEDLAHATHGQFRDTVVSA